MKHLSISIFFEKDGSIQVTTETRDDVTSIEMYDLANKLVDYYEQEIASELVDITNNNKKEITRQELNEYLNHLRINKL